MLLFQLSNISPSVAQMDAAGKFWMQEKASTESWIKP